MRVRRIWMPWRECSRAFIVFHGWVEERVKALEETKGRFVVCLIWKDRIVVFCSHNMGTMALLSVGIVAMGSLFQYGVDVQLS